MPPLLSHPPARAHTHAKGHRKKIAGTLNELVGNALAAAAGGVPAEEKEEGGGVLAIAVKGKDGGVEGEIKYRINKADLVFLKEKLGQGAFGLVEKGIYKLQTANKGETIEVFVAIKMVNAEFLEDAKAMADIVAENVSVLPLLTAVQPKSVILGLCLLPPPPGVPLHPL